MVVNKKLIALSIVAFVSFWAQKYKIYKDVLMKTWSFRSRQHFCLPQQYDLDDKVCSSVEKMQVSSQNCKYGEQYLAENPHYSEY